MAKPTFPAPPPQKKKLGNNLSYYVFNTLFLILCAILCPLIDLIGLQQKGTFETGQEDSAEIPEELRLRLAYREAAVAVLACYFPEPHRPFVEVAADIFHTFVFKI